MAVENGKGKPPYSDHVVQLARNDLELPSKAIIRPHQGLPPEEMLRLAGIARSGGGLSNREVAELKMKLVQSDNNLIEKSRG